MRLGALRLRVLLDVERDDSAVRKLDVVARLVGGARAALHDPDAPEYEAGYEAGDMWRVTRRVTRRVIRGGLRGGLRSGRNAGGVV